MGADGRRAQARRRRPPRGRSAARRDRRGGRGDSTQETKPRLYIAQIMRRSERRAQRVAHNSGRYVTPGLPLSSGWPRGCADLERGTTPTGARTSDKRRPSRRASSRAGRAGRSAERHHRALTRNTHHHSAAVGAASDPPGPTTTPAPTGSAPRRRHPQAGRGACAASGDAATLTSGSAVAPASPRRSGGMSRLPQAGGICTTLLTPTSRSRSVRRPHYTHHR